MGETLNQFIQRLRIERAANQLANDPAKSITSVAFDCGFPVSAASSWAFRQPFRMSASVCPLTVFSAYALKSTSTDAHTLAALRRSTGAHKARRASLDGDS